MGIVFDKYRILKDDRYYADAFVKDKTAALSLKFLTLSDENTLVGWFYRDGVFGLGAKIGSRFRHRHI
jgi:hypothetical protein